MDTGVPTLDLFGSELSDDCRLYREAGAALGTAGVNNGSARRGAHADAETMGALALNNTGLKCAFHKMVT